MSLSARLRLMLLNCLKHLKKDFPMTLQQNDANDAENAGVQADEGLEGVCYPGEELEITVKWT